eukprot:CAMPEP_0117504800 /NCGR_PEP_ID=MMETSP0784-20121206/25038_1 /TAXON_ID=39447 /ORGANISM="" /LENGTH=192 /DNA_ID=CAMNT_0005300171 /DNA_START=129 /DNA_END=707 /DNA_ORIENTATION=-
MVAVVAVAAVGSAAAVSAATWLARRRWHKSMLGGAESPAQPADLGVGYKLRWLESGDFGKGFPRLLKQLSPVGELTEACFAQILARRDRQSDVYRTVVVEHLATRNLAATASLIVEAKFLRAGSYVGHVEDVVVDETHRGQGLARIILAALAETARKAGCYKVILDCNESNVGLYERCGFQRREVQMRLDLT